MAFETYKEITLEDMIAYIDEKAPEFKAEFKEIAIIVNEEGKPKYNSAKAKHAFCKKFMPELLPKKKEPKKTKTQILLDW